MNNAVSIGEPWMWAAFIAFVLVMLALDLFVFGGRKATQGRRQVGVELATADRYTGAGMAGHPAPLVRYPR